MACVGFAVWDTPVSEVGFEGSYLLVGRSEKNLVEIGLAVRVQKRDIGT